MDRQEGTLVLGSRTTRSLADSIKRLGEAAMAMARSTQPLLIRIEGFMQGNACFLYEVPVVTLPQIPTSKRRKRKRYRGKARSMQHRMAYQRHVWPQSSSSARSGAQRGWLAAAHQRHGRENKQGPEGQLHKECR